MQQYREIKSRHPDAILFFRMGDFYEMFWEDAKLAAKTLGVALTSRSRGGLLALAVGLVGLGIGAWAFFTGAKKPGAIARGFPCSTIILQHPRNPKASRQLWELTLTQLFHR